MALTSETVVTQEATVTGTTVSLVVQVTDATDHKLTITDSINGGDVVLSTAAAITELKQLLIDAGY